MPTRATQLGTYARGNDQRIDRVHGHDLLGTGPFIPQWISATPFNVIIIDP